MPRRRSRPSRDSKASSRKNSSLHLLFLLFPLLSVPYFIASNLISRANNFLGAPCLPIAVKKKQRVIFLKFS